MPTLKGEVWLQTECADGTYRCQSFAGVPVARQSWIVLASAGSAEARKRVEDLRAELSAVLLESGPGVTLTDELYPLPPEQLRAEEFPDRRKLLVLVAGTDALIEDHGWYSQWESDAHNAAVMTVLPEGEFHRFFSPQIANNDQHLLCRVNASRWREKIAEVVPRLLSRAEVTVQTARVFISYRRLETLPVALQLFDQLIHEGFEVFLDRFSIPPGYDFQRRLGQELEDKSMVVLLESKHAKDSKWTQHEIDFVKRHRLGFYTLRMPDVQSGEGLSSVLPDAFHQLDADRDFKSPPVASQDPQGRTLNVWQELTPAAMANVVAAVKTTHTRALFRRRQRLRADVIIELRKQGIPVTASAAGPLLVSFNRHEHLLWLVTRPPEVEDFRQTHTAHLGRTGISPESRGVVIGPQAAQEPDRLARLRWLQDVSRCACFDEGRLADFVASVQTGRWP